MSLELCLEHRKCSINVDYNYYMKEFIFLYTAQVLHLSTTGLGSIHWGISLHPSHQVLQL